MRAYEITESRQQLNEWAALLRIVAPIIAGSRWIWLILKFIWNNKWVLSILYTLYEIVPWMISAYEWLEPYLESPVVQFLLKYKLPIFIIAIILYGGNKLYQTIKDAKDEEELKELLINFKADQDHLADMKKQLASMKAKAA